MTENIQGAVNFEISNFVPSYQKTQDTYFVEPMIYTGSYMTWSFGVIIT